MYGRTSRVFAGDTEGPKYILRLTNNHLLHWPMCVPYKEFLVWGHLIIPISISSWCELHPDKLRQHEVLLALNHLNLPISVPSWCELHPNLVKATRNIILEIFLIYCPCHTIVSYKELTNVFGLRDRAVFKYSFPDRRFSKKWVMLKMFILVLYTESSLLYSYIYVTQVLWLSKICYIC